MNNIQISYMKKPLAYYNLDDLFKNGNMIYDKETNEVFKYDINRHRDRLLKNPNNYRVAHSGDYKSNKKIKYENRRS